MARNEVKWGAILSYILIIANALYGLAMAPFILKCVGESEYGVYKTIGSMTASLAVLDVGIGSTLQRYIAKFNALDDKKSSSNFSAMSFIQVAVLSGLTAICSVGLFFLIGNLYGNTFTELELVRSKQIFIIQAVYMVLHIFENACFGIISGYNKFTFSNLIKIIMLICKILAYVVLLPLFNNALVIVSVSLLIEVAVVVIELFYIKFVLKHSIHLYKWDKALFKESFIYTVLLFVQTIIIQFNGNIDNIVIGAVIGTSAVTIYSFAIQIFNMYEQCATAVSGVVLPTITNKIYAGATNKDLESLVVKFGRAQWAVLGAVLVGFIVCGQEFFYLWLGPDFNDAWYLSLILMIPVTFPLIVNVCLAILKVKNLLAFRTISLAYSVVINAILTIIGTRYFGYWAAAVGTSVATIVGSILSMNIYYQKKLGINIFKLYLKIGKGTTLCMGLASISSIILNYFFYGTIWSFVLKVGVFLIIYSATLLLFGFNKYEKEQLFGRIRRRQVK